MKIVSFLFIFLLLFSSCTTKEKTPSKTKDKLIISLSIPPQAYILEQIAGKDRIIINLMIDERQNPHLYTPTIKQIANLKSSRAYIKLGVTDFPLEDKIDKVLKDNNIEIINMSKGIDFMAEDDHEEDKHALDKKENKKEDKSHVDSHIYLSLNNIKTLAENTYYGLVKVDEAGKQVYKNNLSAFIKKLDKANARIKNIFSTLKNRSFVIYHPTLGYFAKDYALEQVAMEKEGKEISMSSMEDIISLIRKNKVKGIITQIGFNKKFAMLLAEQEGLFTRDINPLKMDVLSNVEDIALIIRECIGK